MRGEERAALVSLLHTHTGWADIACDVLDHGAVEVLRRRVGEIEPALSEAQGLITGWEADGIGVHSFLDESYPSTLRGVYQMPLLVFTRGALAADHCAIAVVGTRGASEPGKRIAAQVAETLVASGMTVVSGLAQGIDTAAHEATLRAGGRTVAVIGTGIDRFYPSVNEPLQRRIADEGLVLSPFPPGAGPTRLSFPARNAVMSGYAAATVVIEAPQRSGARMQARFALEHGRGVVLRRELLEHDWALACARRPGVYVVGDAVELVAAVDEIAGNLPRNHASLEELPDFAAV